jgi:hypothetical protein
MYRRIAHGEPGLPSSINVAGIQNSQEKPIEMMK